jgi:hypothetical protein
MAVQVCPLSSVMSRAGAFAVQVLTLHRETRSLLPVLMGQQEDAPHDDSDQPAYCEQPDAVRRIAVAC